MRKIFFTFFLVAFSFALASNVWAHAPRYVQDDQLVIIKNPEVSQAFYGELKGRPAYYLIDLKVAQDLYFQILAPDLPGIQKDKTVTIEYAPELGRAAAGFSKIDPASADWKNFYEDYGGDNYLEGPSLKKFGQAGYYLIKITSPDNSGKYVLAVGEQEKFGAPELASALIVLPRLKKNFFQEPVSQWFRGKIAKYFGLIFLVSVIFVFLFYKFRRIYK